MDVRVMVDSKHGGDTYVGLLLESVCNECEIHVFADFLVLLDT